jgi:uncharacterized membrane protein/plastocyanin
VDSFFNQAFYQQALEWALLLGRWLHILVGITWIGTSIFFMWLDRSIEPNPKSTRPGSLGELWMVHGGGFYHVEKLQMGPTQVPEVLHWFKWESYWTWMSGIFLLVLIFYTGGGTFLLDSSVSNLTYGQALALAVGSVVGSWFFYDLLWESKLAAKTPVIGHLLTAAWFGGMAYLLCHTLSGRAAYIHLGAMIGTWMTANVFLRIIPRQVKMVEAVKQGKPVDPTWAKNAKHRSTHNTYLTLPVIFVMVSNHFPSTYGHRYNWLILLLISVAGAMIREFFIARIKNPSRAFKFGGAGALILLFVMIAFREDSGSSAAGSDVPVPVQETAPEVTSGKTLRGFVKWSRPVPEPEALSLPLPCMQGKTKITNNDVLIQNQRLQNVLVIVSNPPKDRDVYSFPSPQTLPPVVLDQKYCLYEPRLIAVRTGQAVDIVNSDPIFHNVKSTSKANEEFNLAMPGQNDRIRRVFSKSEISVQTKCSVHPWMTGYIAILDHPYFAVTNAQGEFQIGGLKPGKWELQFWHERFGTQNRTVEISPDKISSDGQPAAPIEFEWEGK